MVVLGAGMMSNLCGRRGGEKRFVARRSEEVSPNAITAQSMSDVQRAARGEFSFRAERRCQG